MDDLSGFLFGSLVVIGLVYSIFLRPKYEKKCEDLIFDNRVLGFIDGLYISGIMFGCTDFEMRNYVKRYLSKAHDLPVNEIPLRHTASNGWTYSSHTGLHGEHMLFALLCIAQYAKEHNNDNLLSWCESEMEIARKSGINY